MTALVLAVLAWATAAPMPEARTEVAAAVVRGEIVLVGGLTADGAPSARVDAYSPAADRWRRLPDLPAGVHHALAASDGRRLYVVGGYGNLLGGGGPTRSAYVYDNRAWHALPRLPEPRAAGGAAVLHGKLYVLGGRAPGGLARTAFVLDLATRRWLLTPAPTPREHLAVTAAAGRSTPWAAGYKDTTRISGHSNPGRPEPAGGHGWRRSRAHVAERARRRPRDRSCRSAAKPRRGRSARSTPSHSPPALAPTAGPSDPTPRPRCRRSRRARVRDRRRHAPGPHGQRCQRAHRPRVRVHIISDIEGVAGVQVGADRRRRPALRGGPQALHGGDQRRRPRGQAGGRDRDRRHGLPRRPGAVQVQLADRGESLPAREFVVQEQDQLNAARRTLRSRRLRAGSVRSRRQSSLVSSAPACRARRRSPRCSCSGSPRIGCRSSPAGSRSPTSAAPTSSNRAPRVARVAR